MDFIWFILAVILFLVIVLGIIKFIVSVLNMGSKVIRFILKSLFFILALSILLLPEQTAKLSSVLFHSIAPLVRDGLEYLLQQVLMYFKNL